MWMVVQLSGYHMKSETTKTRINTEYWLDERQLIVRKQVWNNHYWMRMYNRMENDWSKIPEAKYDSKMVVKMVDDAQTAHHMEHTMYNSLKQTPQHKDNGLKRNGFDTPKHEENK